MTILRHLLLLACLAIAAFAAVPAGAQAPYVDDRYPHLLAPRDQRPRILSIPQGSRQAPRAARPAESIRPPAATTARGPATEGSAPTTFVLVLGDNLGEWLAYGLGPAFEDVPELGIIDRSRLASGLTRPDVLDWTKAVPETFAGIAKIDFVVMLLGSNDRQAIRLERETVDPEDERWRGLYAERVDQVMQAMKARGVPVYWVGVPPLRGQRLSTHMQLLNTIYKERAERNGVTFVDVWNGFVDEHGNYTQFGPDFAGQIRRLRTADGVHFTIAGARKLALFLEQELRRDLVGRITPALPPGTDPGAPAPPAGGPEATAPGTVAPGTPVPAAPPRPAIGPVFVLHGNPALPQGTTAPSAAPAGGQLAGGSGARPAGSAAASVLVRGEAPVPMTGRIDDFRWPRPAEAAVAPAAGPTARSP
ncbi:SGNH family hydrolase [Phreatobacter sp.]|uniref:SGNH/GDSL hydrolase family protein n=1 Tax=Phreatobacter sp. TaxID=1966341 RepID=UPI0022CCBBAD|nr:SGNH family hydrolase [Phreatobacter sp.]MCZ8315522.1 GDSL-type esterase/lipase family protein [Phreatobacter sp.]